MIIFKKELDKKNNTTVGKYEVKYDRDSILELRENAIKRCSIVRRVKDVLSESKIDSLANDEHIANIEMGCLVDQMEYYDSDEVEKYFSCSYDLYTFSNIVSIIDRLLNNDVLVMNDLDTVLNGNYNGINLDKMKKELVALSNEIDKIDNSLLDLKVKKLKEYNVLLDQYNQSVIVRENEEEYIKELQSLIQIERIESLKSSRIESLNDLLYFFGGFNTLENYFLDNGELLSNSGKKKKLERKK